jgi:acyl-CoA thioesterase-1
MSLVPSRRPIAGIMRARRIALSCTLSLCALFVVTLNVRADNPDTAAVDPNSAFAPPINSHQPQFSNDPNRIVILGDSLTAGYNLDDDQSFPAVLEKKLIDAKLDQHWMIINAGVSGDTSADGLHRLNWILRQPVTVLVVALGGNDGLRGLNVKLTEANLQAIIDQTRAKYPKVTIVIAGMLMPPNMGPDYTTAFAAIFPRLAERNQAILIPFLLEGVAGQPNLNQPDGIHPNAAGAQIVADNVWKSLQPIIQTDPVAEKAAVVSN